MLLFCQVHVFPQKCDSITKKKKEKNKTPKIGQINFPMSVTKQFVNCRPRTPYWARNLWKLRKAIIIYDEHPHSLLVSFPSDLALWAPLLGTE